MSSAILKRKPWGVGAIVAGAALAAGCASQVPENPRATRVGVVMGEPSGAADDAVVQVRADAGSVINNCSGSLVADKLVLTARHCVAFYTDDTFSCTADGELSVGSKGGQMGPLLEPSKVSVHVGSKPGKAVALGVQIFALQTPSICRNDIALVLLDRALVGLPLLPLRLHRGTSPGEVVRFVGYGESTPGTSVERNARDGFTIAQVGSSSFRPMGDLVPPRTLVTEGPGGCPGDSGGPILSADNAAVGIFSQVTGVCTSATARDFFTEVAPFASELFEPAFAAANAAPMLEAQAGGVGGAPSEAPPGGAPSEAPPGGAPALEGVGGNGQGGEQLDAPSAGAAVVVTPGPAGRDPSCRIGAAGSRCHRGPLAALVALALGALLMRRRA